MSTIQTKERWAHIGGVCVEVPGTYDHLAMAAKYHNVPIMERWSGTKDWYFIQYNYLGRKPVIKQRIHPQLRALQLIL